MSDLQKVERLSRDAVKRIGEISSEEARYLVYSYYQMQRYRIRSDNQIRSLEGHTPHEALSWLNLQTTTLENQIKRALDKYSLSNPVGAWSRSVVGIGPVIAAGLLANIDITKANTAGKVWAFAGLNPNQVWGKGEKRPWNAELKSLCWKAGESFVKFSNHEQCFYGKLWAERRAYEFAKNKNGEYSEQAKKILATRNFGDDTEARLWLSGKFPPIFLDMWFDLSADSRRRKMEELHGHPDSIPMLPPAHIHARAKRWAVKMFLSHWHTMAYRLVLKQEPPAPYPIAILGHVDYIAPPTLLEDD